MPQKKTAFSLGDFTVACPKHRIWSPKRGRTCLRLEDGWALVDLAEVPEKARVFGAQLAVNLGEYRGDGCWRANVMPGTFAPPPEPCRDALIDTSNFVRQGELQGPDGECRWTLGPRVLFDLCRWVESNGFRPRLIADCSLKNVLFYAPDHAAKHAFYAVRSRWPVEAWVSGGKHAADKAILQLAAGDPDALVFSFDRFREVALTHLVLPVRSQIVTCTWLDQKPGSTIKLDRLGATIPCSPGWLWSGLG